MKESYREVLFAVIAALLWWSIGIGCLFLNSELVADNSTYHKDVPMENDFSSYNRNIHLTPEQQRIMVREGHVYLDDGTELINNQENKIYLDEGGLERGN